MADFTKRIAIEVDLLTGKLKKGMTDFRTSVSTAEGPVNKLKAGASSLGQTMRGLPFTAVAGGAALAGAAVTKFAIDSVNKYADMALAADDVAAATGLSVDEASRWISLAGDFGISGETIQRTMARMERELGENAEKFEEFGIAIARTDSGAIDTNGTFLNLLDTLRNTKDPTERAAIAQELLGRRYQDLGAILNMTRGEIEGALDATNEWELVTEESAKQAREWQLATDQLGDVMGSFSTELGSSLLPVLTDVVETGTDVVTVIRNVKEGVKGIDLPDLPGWADWGIKVAGFANPTNVVTEAIGFMADKLTDSDEAAGDAAEGQEALQAQFDLTRNAMVETTEASEELLEAYDNLTSASDDVADAEDNFRDALDELQEDLKKARDDSNNAADATRNMDRVYREARQAAVQLADGQVQLSHDTAVANGDVFTAEDAQREWRFSMLNSAAAAEGPLREAILKHIARVDAIPTDVMTDIQAAIDEGDVAHANDRLNAASEDRTSNIRALADSGSINGVESQLEFLARDREARVRTTLIGPTGTSQFQSGGTSTGGVALVGEQGPELVDLPSGARVTPAEQTARQLRGDTTINNVSINVRREISAQELVRLERLWRRHNGEITLL